MTKPKFEDSTEVANAAETKTVVVQSEAVQDGDVMLSTLNTDTFADKKRAFVALDSAESARENGMIDKPFELTGYALIAATFIDEETGDVQDTTRVVLVSGDKSYSIFSDPVARSVRNINASFGHPDSWDEPLTVKLVSGLTAKKHTFYKLDVIL